VWPGGVVGSITHCRGYRACAVASANDVAALGVDAQPNEALPPGVLERIATAREREVTMRRVALSAHTPVNADTLLFSAKEAVYKAWFPLSGRGLGFKDVELAMGMESRSFYARFLVSEPVVGGRQLTQLQGRWSVERRVIATAVVVPQPGAARPVRNPCG
jgi:4'-phosphopantetheinyl transferase EntD